MSLRDDQLIEDYLSRRDVSRAPDWGDLQDIYNDLRDQGRTLVRLARHGGGVQRYLLDGCRSLTHQQLLVVIRRERRASQCAA